MQAMYTVVTLIKRYTPIIALVVIVVFVVGGLTYLAGTLGITREPVRAVPTLVVTALPPAPGTPIEHFFQVDAAIIEYLDYRQPSYSIIPLDALGLELQPVGAYLPRTGDTQFDLAAPTPLPTPLPYPTSPPLPLPFMPQTILPTVSAFTEDGTPRTVPYEVPVDTNCAPAGRPVTGILTQRFHMYHSGIDIGVPLGTPVLATHSGQVSFAGWSEIGYGYLVILQSGPYITYYAHNTSFNVSVGQFVGKGSIIAWSGSTGNSTGPHVHYETRINDIPVDPLTFENRGFSTC
jgi:murein DD-endopeptidase MepM/ murein hydrolase activator NlpD